MVKLRFEKCGGKEIVSIVVCVLSIILWFSLFFPLLFPQIQVNTVYGDANCTIVSARKVPYTCCYKSCSYCSSCSWSDRSCSYLLSASTPGSCCDGYRCCSDCCQTCESCSSGSTSSSRSCSSYSCNCYCCDSVSNLACTVHCPNCWKVVVDADYTCSSDSQCCSGVQSGMYSKDCGRDESCADQLLLQPYLQYNSTSTCYYNPDQCSQIEFLKGYTWWYWLIWAFPTLAILFLLNFWTFVGLNTKIDNWRISLMIYLAIWWVILFPLVFMVPLATVTKTDQVHHEARTGILAAAFTTMAIALGSIGVLYYSNYGFNCGRRNDFPYMAEHPYES